MLIEDLAERSSNGMRFLPVGWLATERRSRIVSVNDIDLLRFFVKQAEDLNMVIDRFRSSRTCPVCADLKTLTSAGIPIGFQNLVLPASADNSYWFFSDIIVHHMEVHGYEPPELFLVDLRRNHGRLQGIEAVRSAIASLWVSERRYSPVPARPV